MLVETCPRNLLFYLSFPSNSRQHATLCIQQDTACQLQFASMLWSIIIHEHLAVDCLTLLLLLLLPPLVSACLHRGVVPFSQRKKMLEKARAKNKKPKSSAGISSIPNITVGTQVSSTPRRSLASLYNNGHMGTSIIIFRGRCVCVCVCVCWESTLN